MGDNTSFDFFEMIKQAADMAVDKALMDAAKDQPMMMGLIKLLNEYGIHGVRAHEFIMRMSAVCSFFNEEGKKDDKT